MKSVIAVSIVGILGFVGTAFDPALEMWAPLIVACVPLMVFIMWPDRGAAEPTTRSAAKQAA